MRERLFCRMAEVFAGFLSYTDAKSGASWTIWTNPVNSTTPSSW